jgi:hypothetical protein
MRETLIATMPTMAVLLYAGAQLSARSAFGRMFFSSTFVPELVLSFAFAVTYVFSLRYLIGKQYFAASIAGVIIGVALFIVIAFWLFFNFEFPRDLSV